MALTAPQLIERTDLLAALERAAARKVTVISAPAGSGKTSLLRAWADGPGHTHRLAVMQVQRDQRDAQQFWLALLQVVRLCIGTQTSEEAPATPDFNERAMVERVLSEFAVHRDPAYVIVDRHELTSSQARSASSRNW